MRLKVVKYKKDSFSRLFSIFIHIHNIVNSSNLVVAFMGFVV